LIWEPQQTEWDSDEWTEELPFIEHPKPVVKHQPGCPGFHPPVVCWPCGGVFVCARCGGYFGWCYGAADGTEADEWCDDCWYEVYGKKES
jgi:hypothetical protein